MIALVALGGAALGGVVAWLALRQRAAPASDPALALMQQQLDGLRTQLDQRLEGVTTQVNTSLQAMSQQLQTATGRIGSQLIDTTKTVGEVRQSLGELSQATQQVFAVGKDIAGLQEILRAPKVRGTLGELFLGDLLAQMIPAPHYALQHRFQDGEIVDAAIRLGQGLVPVDAKFPLENFRRILEARTEDEKKTARKKFAGDVKRHVDVIAAKYIRPDEGTFDFALMYIPAENVYYEMIQTGDVDGPDHDDRSIAAYALSRRVVPVSPNSFYAYLQVILLGLKGLKVEEHAKEILDHLGRLKGEFGRFQQAFEVLGSHLKDARGRYEDSAKRLERFGDRLLGLEQDPGHDQLPGGSGPASDPAPS